MASVEDFSRAILAVVSPLFGERATGTATIRSATGAGDVTLSPSAYLFPLLPGYEGVRQPVKVARNPATGSGGKWAVTEAGVSVDIVSNVGGAKQNLDAGTELVWDPRAPDGIFDESLVLTAGLTGGTDATGDAFRDGVIYEQITGGLSDLEAFSASLEATPGVMVAWTGTTPATGSTQPDLDRGSARVGRSMLYKEDFTFAVLTNLLEGDVMRRGEGMRLLDAATELLIDRKMVDGFVVSGPDGIQIRDRFRISTRGEQQMGMYLYGIRLSITRAITKTDARTFNPWLRTTVTHTKDGLVVVG